MSIKKEPFKKKDENVEELLVFGYSCKLFRDDEKAKIIDEGQHLIPWMGLDALRIDRYDARGTLPDLTRYEPPPGGFDQFIELTENEKSLEYACDTERYRALHTNEEQEEMYKEEQEKRSEKAYGQVGYQYNETTEEIGPKPEPEIEEDAPFVAAPMLDIPVNMSLPTTMKHNAVIEKTAMFLSSQGAQMEIILKAKQANNPMFDFLTFGNPLHEYYKLVLNCVKSGRYIPVSKPEPPPSPPPPPAIASDGPPGVRSIDESTSYYELLGKLKKRSKIEEDTNDDKSVSQIATDDSQLIILKTACYAVKNGRNFESLVKLAKNPRFEFLEPSHTLHNFYVQKITHYKKLGVGKEKKPEPRKKEEPKNITPISFAIKPKEVPAVIEKSALPLEDNSDDDDFDLENVEVKVPTVRDKQLQLERKKKVSAFLKSLNVKEEPKAGKRPRSTSFEDDVRPDATVAEVSKAIEEQLGIPSSEQKLLYKGKPLIVPKTLPDYNIGDGATIYIMKKKNEASGSATKTDVLQIEMLKYLRRYFTEDEAQKVTTEYMRNFNKKISECSLDDYERMAMRQLESNR